jgi:hypothetical protein
MLTGVETGRKIAGYPQAPLYNLAAAYLHVAAQAE